MNDNSETRGSARGRVLVLSDDLERLAPVRNELELVGLEVVRAASAARAVAELGKASQFSRSFDLLVVGRRLSVGGVLGLLSSLRRADWQIPVVLITDFGADGLRDRASGLGAVAVLEEPLDVEDLVTVVLLATSVRPAIALSG